MAVYSFRKKNNYQRKTEENKMNPTQGALSLYSHPPNIPGDAEEILYEQSTILDRSHNRTQAAST
ncbi:hypothetical protein XENTR_v10002160 [Xenopus tropicalis]|nr:hypothetical protein XENTR_v10002160 [Xenopus tropicalis]